MGEGVGACWEPVAEGVRRLGEGEGVLVGARDEGVGGAVGSAVALSLKRAGEAVGGGVSVGVEVAGLGV